MTTHPTETKRLAYDAIVEQVFEIVSGVAEREVLGEDTNLASVGLDSMSLLDIMALIEKRFDIVLTEDVVEELYSVKRIARIVYDAVKAS